MKFYKNKSGRYEAQDRSTYFTSGQPVKYLEVNLDIWIDGRIEHNGKDYYFISNSGKKISLYDGVILKDERK
ncbi:DUF5348 domain-containing protein [Clostridium sp.]|uniref:DUF5348 domain-containing protein n=1 Tax=Clostridium sp. TaxID=1506 RepID=UPI0026221ADD|nr:DUF5348 domain-containing protein [Clostridium sp.]